MRAFLALGLALMLGPLTISVSRASQPLETESARALPRGAMKFEASLEWQTSPEGTETAVPLVFDYGLSDRLELSLEPVVNARITPDAGKGASGVGDLEATLKWVVRPEREQRVGIALGFEVKVPTANDRLIGTGKTDWRTFVAASHRHERWDWHANAGYTVLGKPPGLKLDNVFDAGLAMEYHASDRLDWIGEVTGSSAAVGETPDSPAGAVVTSSTALALNPEIGSEELVGMLGLRYFWRKDAAFTFGVTYDNEGAVSVRPGVSVRW